MRLAQNFVEIPGPDDMASCVLKLLKEGDPQEALPIVCAAVQSATGASFFELNALAAMTAAKAGFIDISLDYWDKIVRSAPQKLQWLSAALNTAWNVAHENGNKYYRDWSTLLEHVFVETPGVEVLMQLSGRGWRCKGSAGIHDGYLKGWLWLNKGEKPKIIADMQKREPFVLNITPKAETPQYSLYEINADIGSSNSAFQVSILDGAGEHICGSPVTISPGCTIRSAAGNVARKNAGQAFTILVPVYDDANATLVCLGNLFASQKKNRTRTNILVVWDHGPDETLLTRLRALATRGKLRLIENPCNLGFLASVNHALSQVPSGNVILLNSDTIVLNDWIDRLVEAGAGADAATVTALSNEAELMSYPSAGDRGKIDTISQVRILDSAAARLNAKESLVEIPVGVGFCMLITRKALDQIGGLDGTRLFRGYGEEVDFCLRASASGLKNYGAFNVFIGHQGERSFGVAKKALASQNNEAIFNKFPDYRREYEVFLTTEKPRLLREEVSAGCLSQIQAIGTLELRPWSNRYLPPWIKDEKCRPQLEGGALFIQGGPQPRALLRIWTKLPLAEMHFDLVKDKPKLIKSLLALRCRELEAHGCGESIMEMASGFTEKIAVTESKPAKAQPYDWAKHQGETILAAPPQDMKGWRELCKCARTNIHTRFLVFYLDALWPGTPRPANILEMPNTTDFSIFESGAFLLFGKRLDPADWRVWLDSHACGHIEIYQGCHD